MLFSNMGESQASVQVGSIGGRAL